MLTAIDTHQFVKSFIMAVKSKEKSAEKQAELIVKTINESQQINFENLVTKQELKSEIQSVKVELKNEIKLLRNEIKIAMLTTIISLGTIMAFIQKFVG